MTDITLSTTAQQARGVIARYPTRDDRYIFEFDACRPRLIHMIGVHRPLRVQWIADGECVADRVLRPWWGWGRHRCDRVIESRP